MSDYIAKKLVGGVEGDKTVKRVRQKRLQMTRRVGSEKEKTYKVVKRVRD